MSDPDCRPTSTHGPVGAAKEGRVGRERTQPRHLYSDKGWRMSQHGPVLLGDGQSQRTLIPSDFPALQGFLPTQPRWASSLWLNPSSDVDLGVSPKAPTPRLNRGPFCTLFLTLPSASLQTAPAHAPPRPQQGQLKRHISEAAPWGGRGPQLPPRGCCGCRLPVVSLTALCSAL